jgi:hypothetical protein
VDQQDSRTDSLRRLGIRVGIYVGVFLAGAILAFLYSYIPLHNAKNWKIDYLEERLVSKDNEIELLEQRLASLEIDAADKPDGQTFKQVQGELVSADKTVKDLEQQVRQLERQARELEKAGRDWKSKYDAAEATRIATDRANPRDASGQAEPLPAAPDLTGNLLVSDSLVPIGTRWQSPDGGSDFDLVAISGDVAQVIPNASSLRPGAVPKLRDVSAGEQFKLAAPGGRFLHVVVERFEGTAGIVIDVTD